MICESLLCTIQLVRRNTGGKIEILLSKEFDPHRPIYLQVVESFQRALARGELSPGEQVPAVRETAARLLVNPNTVQRAYQELERMGLLATRRGLGTFVTNEESMVGQIRDRLAEAAAKRYLDEMRGLGLSPEQAVDLLAGLHSRPSRKARGGK